MKKKLVGMLATATLLTMALAGNLYLFPIRCRKFSGLLTDIQYCETVSL